MVKEHACSKCGFYCDQCPAFKDNSRTQADREQGSAQWEKYFGLHFKPDIVKCEGCQALQPWKTGNLLPDRTCPIRVCAVYNDVPTCAHCALFPCDEYTQRVPGPELRRQRETALNTQITDDEFREYLEPFDGQTHLRQLHAGLPAEDIAAPRPFSTSETVTLFPGTTNLSPADEDRMRRLHSLLTTVFSQRAPSYASQIVLERKKVYLRGLIWVLGLYGQVRDNKLILESAVNQDKKECARLVRKTDNKLHYAVEDAVRTLNSFGIQVEFKPSGKNWELNLDIDKNTGSPDVLEALKIYVSTLAGKYGTPAYVGSYNLKGKAFKLFTRLDMSDLIND